MSDLAARVAAGFRDARRAVRGAHMTPFPLVSAGFGVPNPEENT
jgi:hypothetical protein